MAELFANYIIWISLGLVFSVMLVMFFVAPCHAALLLPFAGLPLFWLLPLEYALPINIAAWLASPFLYRAIRRAMRRPISDDGFRCLVGIQAEVVSKSETVHSAKYLVRARGEGELWSAYSSDVLNVGEWVNIVSVKGIGMVVERGNKGPHTKQLSGVEAKQAGRRANERNCH